MLSREPGTRAGDMRRCLILRACTASMSSEMTAVEGGVVRGSHRNALRRETLHLTRICIQERASLSGILRVKGLLTKMAFQKGTQDI